MIIGLVLALIFNFDRKRKEGKRESGEAVSRRYLEVNTAFYLTGGHYDSVPAQLVFTAGPGR